jgi:integrase
VTTSTREAGETVGRPKTQEGTHGSIHATPERRTEAGSWVKATSRTAERWRAKTRVRDDDGVLRQVVKTGRTRAAAEAALKAALRDREAPSAPAMRGFHKNMLVAAAAELWLASVQRADSGKAQRTKDQYAACVKNHVRGSSIASMEIRRVKVSTVEAWLQGVADATGTGAAKTARTVLSNILDTAMRDGALDINPARQARPAKAEKSRQTERDTARALTKAERDHLLAVADRDPGAEKQDVADIVAWMAGTGVRIGEALAQRWEDVDLETGVVVVRGTKTASSTRTITIPQWLRDRLVRRAKIYGTTGVVFHSPGDRNKSARPSRERPRDRRNVQRIMRQVLDAAGYDWATPHSLRRTVASLADQGGMPIQSIARHLGHADPSMTMRVYLDRTHVADLSDVL